MSAYGDCFEDVHRLLDPPSVKYDYWEKEVADKKLFYVRGFTWFRREICRNITDLNNRAYIKQMYSLLEQRKPWLDQPYPWDEAYGWKQAYHASQRYNRTEQHQLAAGEYKSRKSQTNTCVLKFHKAAKTILFCEAVTRATGKDGESVYENMRIQPACAYIHGFTSTVLDGLRKDDEDFTRKLREATGQMEARVFDDMARFNFLVTYHLACRVHQFISTNYAAKIRNDFGEVDVRLNSNYQPQPSIYENIEVNYGDDKLIKLTWEREAPRRTA